MFRNSAVFISLVLTFFLLVVARPPQTMAAGRELTVAAAADLNDCLKVIASQFEENTGAHVTLVFGASGNLASQIRNGAPYDVFLSADADYPTALARDGFADSDSVQVYAVGSLAVMTPANSSIDFAKNRVQGFLDPAIKRISIANPNHAPYGRAAVAMLRAAGIDSRVSSKLVLGENVAQAAQFVMTGNADAGIVSLAQAKSASANGKFRYWEPPATYPAINQAAAITSRARDRDLARRFLAYLNSPAAVRTFSQFGFKRPNVQGPPGVATKGSGATEQSR